MKISVNFTTYGARKHIIDKAVGSIQNQTVRPDEIRVYYNDYTPPEREWTQFVGLDLTDRGKFHFLREDEIYFTCDDDILYPPFYIEYMLNRLEDYPECIVSLHGRRLQGRGLDYYNGHTQYHFMSEQIEDHIIDVPGTGVSVFNTNHFMPELEDKDKMVDVLIGLEAARQGVDVVCVAHSCFWMQGLDQSHSIYRELSQSCEVQSALCDQIWQMKY